MNGCGLPRPSLHPQLHDVSMIQDMDREKRNLIVYDMVTGTRFLLRAGKTSTRDTWLDRSSLLIQQAKMEMSKELASRARSVSEPADLIRTFSFSRKSVFRRDREESRRKAKRPSSSTGVRPAQTAEEMVGTSVN